MNAKIDYQTTVTNTLIADINDMANDASNYSVNPGKDFTRKRKLDFYNLIMFLIIMGNSNTDYELVKYFNFNGEKLPGKSAFIQQRSKLKTDSILHLMKVFNSHYQLGVYKGKYNNTEDIPRLYRRRGLFSRSVGVQSPTERKQFFELPLLVKSRALKKISSHMFLRVTALF